MPLEVRIALGLVLASLVAYAATPLAVRLAQRFELYDLPGDGYKIHAAPTPYLGGAAILVALMAAVPVLALGDDRLFLLLGGGIVLWLTGTIDDRRPLSPTLRVLIEAGVGFVLYAAGEHWSLGLGGAVDAVVTAAWVVGVVNAFNLIDNMDGVASVLGLAAAATIAVLASLGGDVWLTVAAVALAGACLGFLPHNLQRPSRIFLGDGGSMLVGFGTAALGVMLAGESGSAWQSLTVGLMIVALPVSDMLVRAVSRRRRGISPMVGGRDSVTHHVRVRLPTARAVAFTLGGAQALIAALVIAASESGPRSGAALLLVFVALVGAGIAVLRGEAPASTDSGPRTTGHVLVLHAPAIASSGVVAALVAGAPFAGGYYSSEIWAPAGLAATGLLVTALVARPPRLGLAAGWALAALAALALWALLSSTWAGAPGLAMVEGNRLVVYAALLALLLVCIRSRRAALWQVGLVAAAVMGVAMIELVRMALGDGPDLFLGGRLHEPLGYINGLGAFFLIGFWSLLAIAEQRRSAIAAGLGLAGAYLAAVLVLLSQSRGVALAAIVSALIVLLVVPGRVRRAVALAGVLAGLAALAGSPGELYRSGLHGAVDPDLAVTVAIRALPAAAVLGIAWGAAVAGFGHAVRPQIRRGAIVALCAVALGACGAAIWNAGDVGRTLDRQYQAFVNLSPAAGGEPTSSRLLSGVGYRYDYWRIAVNAFGKNPVAGVGAGNYPATYFRERATAEDIRQPHSLAFQTMAELGLVGAVLLLGLAVAVIFGAARMVRRAARDPWERLVAVAGIGAVSAWFVQTNVDWTHLLPGVTLPALVGAALLLRQPSGAIRDDRGAAAPARHRRRAIGVGAAVAVGLVLVSLTLARQTVSETYARDAQQALASSPGEALDYADRTLRLNPDLVRAYYTKAAALARLGDGAASAGALRDGLRRDPDNFVTLALLGDLAVRRGDFAGAGRRYAAAHRHNPREPGLAQLARDPQAVSERPDGR